MPPPWSAVPELVAPPLALPLLPPPFPPLALLPPPVLLPPVALLPPWLLEFVLAPGTLGGVCLSPAFEADAVDDDGEDGDEGCVCAVCACVGC